MLVLHAQNEISALASVLKKNFNDLLMRLDTNFERRFVESKNVLSWKVMELKNTTHAETKQTVGVYTNG